MWAWWLASAFAGELVVDAQVPVEIRQNLQTLATLYFPGELHMSADPGKTVLIFVVNGTEAPVELDIPTEGSAVVVVGRTGITTGQRPADDAPPPTFELRASGDTAVTVVLDGARIAMRPGESRIVPNRTAVHEIGLRDATGTVVWAHGTLVVSGVGPHVVQVSEGRMPVVSGAGGRFDPSAP